MVSSNHSWSGLSPQARAHLAVLAANLLFAVNFSVVKYVTPALILPFGLNVVRVLITTALFWLLLLYEVPKQKIQAGDIPLLIFCGITGVAVNQLLFIKGLSMTYSTHAALLMLSTPIVITVVAFFFLRERLTVWKGVGLLLGVSGAMVLILGGGRSGSGNDVLRGNLYVMLNAISYSFYFVMVKPLMQRYAPLQVIRWVFTFGSLIIIPIGWQEFVSAPWSTFTGQQLAAIGFVVLGATFFAYLFNVYGLRHLNASATGSYIYLQPVIAAFVASAFLDEPLTPMKLLSAVLIFAGVYLVNRDRISNKAA